MTKHKHSAFPYEVKTKTQQFKLINCLFSSVVPSHSIFETVLETYNTQEKPTTCLNRLCRKPTEFRGNGLRNALQ